MLGRHLVVVGLTSEVSALSGDADLVAAHGALVAGDTAAGEGVAALLGASAGAASELGGPLVRRPN